MDSEFHPQYEKIALDISGRIVEGEFPEGSRLSGRTVLSGEYRVSSETIRKAIKLLAEMKVVEVKEKSGSVVISTDNARKFCEIIKEQRSYKDLRAQLMELMKESIGISRKIEEVYSRFVETQQNEVLAENRLPNYEVRVSESSDKIGKNLGTLKFWQATGATIIGIKRGKNVIISPGPFAELYPRDMVIFTGYPSCLKKVDYFINSSSE